MRQYIIDRLKEEHISEKNNKYYISLPMFNSVWFYPLLGQFIFNDKVVQFDVISEMIRDKILVFKSIETHQGELMPRYILNHEND